MQNTEAGVTGVLSLDMLSEYAAYHLIGGGKGDGVSKVVKVLDKPALVGWANKLGLQGTTLQEAYNKSTGRGKVAHGRIEARCRDLKFDHSNIPGELMAESDRSVERFFEEFWDKEGCELIDAERQMVDDDLRIGGTLDLYVRFTKRGTTGLIDVKTSSGFYPEQKLQLCGYGNIATKPHRWNPTRGRDASCWEPSEPLVIDEYWIARVGNDEPGDMDAMQLSRTEVELHTEAFIGLARNHYTMKKVLARR